MQVERNSTHGDKLKALLSNSKLPRSDRERVQSTVARYDRWIELLSNAQEDGDELLNSTFRILRCMAEGVCKSLQEGCGDLDDLRARPGHA